MLKDEGCLEENDGLEAGHPAAARRRWMAMKVQMRGRNEMRKMAIGALAVCYPVFVFAFVPKLSATYYEATKPEVREAQRNGAMARLVYRITDDEGNPIANQPVHYCWQNNHPRKRWSGDKATDANGIVVIEDRVGGEVAVSVRRDGFYISWEKVKFDWREGVSPLVKDGKWQPYGEHRTLVVKRKKNPVAMMRCDWGINGCPAPATNVWIGIDLETGQWCKPYGEGKHEDAIVRFGGWIADDFTWDTKTEISFTNVPYAGFYSMQKDVFSDMKSCYTASTNDSAYSEGTIVFTSQGDKNTLPGKQTTDRIARNRYLVFRTRCTVDDTGKLISAHYGKLMGEFIGGGMGFVFRCPPGDECGIFFNPTPNDPNLEDRETINRLQLLGR